MTRVQDKSTRSLKKLFFRSLRRYWLNVRRAETTMYPYLKGPEYRDRAADSQQKARDIKEELTRRKVWLP